MARFFLIKVAIVILFSVVISSCNNGDKEKNIVKTYYPDGTVETEIEYKGIKKNGAFKFYYEDGTLFKTGYYLDNKMGGLCIDFCKNGDTSRIYQFDRGYLIKKIDFENNERSYENNYKKNIGVVYKAGVPDTIYERQ